LKRFFISDTHFSHTNIIKYENRPFKNVQEMDNQMIKNWNNKVSTKDEVYILGDFAFADINRVSEIANQLNGTKFLIKGNHDKNIPYNCFGWVKDYHMLRVDGLKIALFHYPIQVWDCKHHNSLHFYGHIHSNLGNHTMEYDIPNSYNVGADVNNFTPIELYEILDKLGYKEVIK
jgi:calcineurin-like phosphoesterase family protein